MLELDEPADLLVTCARGLAPYLREELLALGHEPREERETGIEIEATLREAYRLNLQLRTAYHVLYRVAVFRCTDPDDLYHEVRELPWEELIAQDGYVSVASRVRHETVRNSMFPNLRTKDAIVDRIAERRGERPDAGPQRDQSVVSLRWFDDEASVFLDLSGQKLSDRGYRRSPHKAPLRETLAAAIVLASGYDGSQPLLNPMCGSGTLAIEAALVASGRAPGLLRSGFGLQHLLGYDEEVWQGLRAEARRATKPGKPAPIVASDLDPQAVEAAQRNAVTAGVDHLIRFEVADFAESPVPEPNEAGGIVLVNPEYGERLGKSNELPATYKRFGDFLKQRCTGYTCWLFTGSKPLSKKVGLRANRRLTFMNGDIECKLLRYELYAGKHRKEPKADGAE